MLGIYQTDDITLVQHGGYDQYGEPLAATNVPLKGRVNWHVRRVFVEEGVEKVASGTVLLDQAPSLRDRLVIDGETFIVLAVRRHKSFSALGHFEVFIQ